MKLWLFISLIILVPAALVISVGREEMVLLTKENGLVESLTAIGFLLSALLCIPFSKKTKLKLLLFLPCTVLFLRELDAHQWLAEMSITKIRFYTSSEIPLLSKIVAILIYGLLGVNLYLLVKKECGFFWESLRKRCAYAVFGAIGALLLIGTKAVIDGAGRKFPFLQEASSTEQLLKVLEECFEFSGSVLILLAVWNFTQREMPERIRKHLAQSTQKTEASHTSGVHQKAPVQP